MKLSDLYAAETPTDSRTFSVLRSDFTDSGHKITLIDPTGDKAAKAAFMFDAAIKRRMKRYEADSADLLKECEEAGDYSQFNVGFDFICQDLRDAFCREVVEGWDFDDDFSEANLQSAIDSFRAPALVSLQRQIIDAFRRIGTERAKK